MHGSDMPARIQMSIRDLTERALYTAGLVDDDRSRNIAGNAGPTASLVLVGSIRAALARGAANGHGNSGAPIDCLKDAYNQCEPLT